MGWLNNWRREIVAATRERRALVLLRVGTGLFFLLSGAGKLMDPHFTARLPGQLSAWALHNPVLPYKAFLTGVVIPHAGIVAQLVAYGEFLLGLSYILGLLVTFSAPMAAFMNLNFLLATAPLSPAALGVNWMCLLAHATIFQARAGETFGLDALLSRPAGAPAAKPPVMKPASGKASGKLKAVQKSLAQARKADKGKPLG